MAVAAWPATLPQYPQKGFRETVGLNIIRSNPDAGPSKQRLRGRGVNTLDVAYILTDTQLNTLNTFIDNTIFGVRRFTVLHPRTGTSIEVRIVPQGNGNLYTATYLAPGFYNVQLMLEILP